jgi:hypothetical protein
MNVLFCHYVRYVCITKQLCAPQLVVTQAADSDCTLTSNDSVCAKQQHSALDSSITLDCANVAHLYRAGRA